MRAAIYLRLSKEDKQESIENQRALLRKYANDHGFSVVKEYLSLYPDKVYRNIYEGGLMGELA